MPRTRDQRESHSDAIRARATFVDWMPAAVALVVISLIQELGLFGSDDSGKLFWSLINLAPALWIVRAVVRGLQRADEYQRRHQLEAMAMGFGVMMMSIFTVGLLQAADIGDPRPQVQISFIGSMLVWVGAQWYPTRSGR
jgi:hypothetical protein